MSVGFPQADFPRTGGGEADLFDAEKIADSDLISEQTAEYPAIFSGAAVISVNSVSRTTTGGPYITPPATAANATWEFSRPYTPPRGNAANVTWGVPLVESVTGDGAGVLLFSGAGIAAHGIAAIGDGALEFAGAGGATHGIVATGAGGLEFTGEGLAEISDPTVQCDGAGALDFSGAGLAAHGIGGSGIGGIAFTGAGGALHGVGATGHGTLSFTGAGIAAQLRYEARGSVKTGLILVNRRVRCYARDTGELLGQADTVDGLYRVHAGFSDAEVYTLAIDLSPGATDWIPPVANRLIPVLASDTE